MIQSQTDFYDFENIIRDEIREEECKKPEIRCDFIKNVEEVLQHRQFKYEMLLCISSEEKKIIHQRYITLNDKYISSEFYI